MSAVALFVVVMAAGVTALVLRHYSQVRTDASKSEFCTYWNHFGIPGSPDDPDPISEEGLSRTAEEVKDLGVPADASEQVQESVQMRIDFLEAWAHSELADRAEPTRGEKETWRALEKYIAREC